MGPNERDIEKSLEQNISPLTRLLGANRVDNLKDQICKLILDQVKRDLDDCDQYVIYDEDIREIVVEALEEVKVEVKKKVVDAYLSIAEKAIVEHLKGE